MHPLDQLHTVRGVPFSSTPGPSGRQENIARVGRVANHSNNRMTTAGFFDGGNRTHRATKRGRPRADLINALIVEGSASAARIRCKLCSRVFPREKSLQAHMRTHTGKFRSLGFVFFSFLYVIHVLCDKPHKNGLI